MSKAEPLLYGQYYHIYNRVNNGETLFCEERSYPYFLKLCPAHRACRRSLYLLLDAKPLSLSRANQGQRRGPAVLEHHR